MVGFIINENLHVWESEGEGPRFRISRENSTSDAVNQGGRVGRENCPSSDHMEENPEF